MTRLPTWLLHFDAFVSERLTAPFAWGKNDCCTFAADCVQAITGTDPAPKGLRDHTTAKQATRALKRHGGVVGIATAALGQPAPVSQACVGDVVMVKTGGREALSICAGTAVLIPAATGLAVLPMSDALLCWRVA